MAWNVGKEKIGPRARESVPSWLAVETLSDLTEVALYRNEIEGETQGQRLSFDDNKALWLAVLESVRATDNAEIVLSEFWLSEWLPLRPGLFHTELAQSSREAALADSIMRADQEEAPIPLRRWLNLPVERVSGGHHLNDHTRLFNPNGKMSMINGGIGCIRLKPLKQRSSHRWLLGASSSGVVHEGVPVALDDAMRDRLIQDIRRWGALQCSIRGILRFVPGDDAIALTYGRGIPQLYLEATEIEPIEGSRGKGPPIEVTAIATFSSRLEEFRGLNASYVTFEAGKRGDLEHAAEWLENTYIRQSYGGRILTDFDEQTRRFENASFSLTKLLNGLVSKEDADEVFNDLELPEYDRKKIGAVFEGRAIFVSGPAFFNQGEIHVTRDIYNVERAGAVGAHATATNTTFIENHVNPLGDVDLLSLAGELARLRIAMQAEANSAAHYNALAAIAEAEDAAKRKDTSTLVSKLKVAGNWAFDTATEIGVSIAANVIQRAIGLNGSAT